jgi:hypothetical protein
MINGYQSIIDTAGLDHYALYVGAAQTNQTTGYSNIEVVSQGDQNTVLNLTGQKITVYDATITNTGLGITVGNNTNFGNTTGISLLSQSTTDSSFHGGITGSMSGDHGDSLGIKRATFFAVAGVCEEVYGHYVTLQGGTFANETFNGVINGSTGDSCGIRISNSNANISLGGDIQSGGIFTVNGDSDPSSTIKFGLDVSVSNDALVNYGLRVGSNGASAANYAILTDEGATVLNDNQTITSFFNVKGGTDSQLFYVDASADNIGVGTSLPTRKFQVNGDYTFVHNPTTDLLSSVEGYGDIVTFGGGSLTAGDLYYLDSLGGWSVADADSTSNSTGMLAFALGTSASDGMLVRGYIRNSGFTTNTGDIVYVSTTAGEVTTTAPSSSGDVIRIIGYSIDGTNEIIYFSPDNSWVEI